jgi:hypothetical protein
MWHAPLEDKKRAAHWHVRMLLLIAAILDICG